MSHLLENLFSMKTYVAALSGAMVMGLGVLMFVKNIIVPSDKFHWWAMFIVLPALMFFGLAWLSAGSVAHQASLVLFGLGLVILTVAAIFLLNLSWERWWPLMVITPAMTLFFLGLPGDARPETAAWVGLLSWLGLATILLGITFQVGNFGLIDLNRLTDRVGWWAIFIALFAFGTAFNGIWLWIKTGTFSFSVVALGFLAFLWLYMAVFEWFQLHWWMWSQWMLIVSGIGLVLTTLIFGQKPNNESEKHPTTH